MTMSGAAEPGRFRHIEYAVRAVQKVDASKLRWPSEEDAASGDFESLNRDYVDLRMLSWSEARSIFELEGRLIGRFEQIRTRTDALALRSDYARVDHELFGLDLGVASTVVALSAARCIPIGSCNAGAFGGKHTHPSPAVGFWCRRTAVPLLVKAAREARVALLNHRHGEVFVNGATILRMRNFAWQILEKQPEFEALQLSRTKDDYQAVPSEGMGSLDPSP
jgi:hypothetical protein